MTTLCANVPNCNVASRGNPEIRRLRWGFARTEDCDHPTVISRSVSRFILICVPLAIFAARLHSRGAGSPVGVTQDVNRCLAVVRAASSRRGGGERERHAHVERPETRTSGLVVSYPPPSVCDIPA
jgi:hypothetical protein